MLSLIHFTVSTPRGLLFHALSETVICSNSRIAALPTPIKPRRQQHFEDIHDYMKLLEKYSMSVFLAAIHLFQFNVSSR